MGDDGAPSGQKMDRGSDSLKAHLTECTMMDVRQTRRGWCQECLGCEARNEFKYFIDGNQIATSLEDSNCCCRMCCQPCYPWTVTVKELNTEAEILSVDRPCACPAGGCKCCCYQSATFTSGGQDIGSFKEECYFCVPSFSIFDGEGNKVYRLHSPTCCGGMCVNCFTEGNPCCGRGCCKVPFWIFDANQSGTDGDVEHLGKILKKPKSAMTEIFTEADAFECHFPQNATAAMKGVLVGAALMLNVLYFEGDQNDGGDGGE